MIEAYKHSNLANPSEQQDNYISAIDTDTTVTDDSSVLERIKSLTKRTVAGITLLALASCGVGNKTEATDQQSAPATVYVTVDNTPEVTSGVESTTPDASETESDASESTESDSSGSEEGTETSDALKQTVSIEQMDSMSLEDFAKLPFADRMAYGLGKIGPEAFHTGDLPAMAIPSLVWQSIFNTAFNDADPNVRAKTAGSYIYYSTDKQSGNISEAYQDNVAAVIQSGGEGVGGSESMVYVTSGQPQHGTDRDGNPIDFTNITYTQDDGTGNSVEWTTQAIKCNVTLLSGEQVTFYAEGYSIAGKKSPVDNYPY